MKPALLLLPGMMCDEWLFGPQVAAFSRSHEVHVGKLTGADTIGDIAKRVLQKIPYPKFSIVGWSMGGTVAMELMRQAGDRIDRIVLMNTSHQSDPPELRVVRRRQMKDVRAGKLREIINSEIGPNQLAIKNRSDQALLDLLIDMALDHGEKAFISQSLALMIRQDYTETLRQWRKPVMLICGAEDAMCTPDDHQELAALLKHCELHVIKDAAHIPTLEQPQTVNDLIGKFLGVVVDGKPESS